ncbi:MAG: peptidoglycan D,D-transpeptidase FtsI family protein, partial [Candidatus Puniceispirillaceae bacterium]
MTTTVTSRLRNLVLPARPDPARSRRIAEVRLVISAVVVLAVFMTIAARVMFLATDQANARTAGIVPPPKAERGQILDRKGRLLATNLPITVLHADPSEIMDPVAAARALAPLLSRHDERALVRLLTKDTRYVELDRKLTPARHAEILNLGIPGIHFRKSTLRAYPSGRLAAHILGQVDPDSNGLAGVEKSLDARLASGANVTLSIDTGIQAIVAREIHKQIQIFDAIGGAGVMLDIASGEVLALVSLPDFNPNHFGGTDADTRFNRATLGLYEMGSTFKVLNTAMALQSKTTTLDRRYEVARPLRVGGHRISDFHVYDWPLTVPEILVLSSNIGSARMAAEIGAEIQQTYLRRLGMFDRLPLEIPEVAKPLVPRSWRQSEIATISYGHGISVTPLHLAAAIATASGNGLWTPPTLLRRHGGDPSGNQPVREKIFSDETTRAVRSMMRLVVKHPDGTGNYAEARGYMVGGKTGTTEKIRPEGGYYKDRNIASFAATFPVHDPRYVLVVMVDEPKGQKHSYGYATGGWVAAPAAVELLLLAPVC